METVFSGKAFEELVLGFTTEPPINGESSYPRYFDFHSSISFMIRRNWQNFAEWKEGKTIWHDPLRPSLGKTEFLWKAVKKYLPKREKGSLGPPLNLYITIGRNSTDYHHGVDLFFWWRGAIVTVDVSLLPKDTMGRLKADFVFKLDDFSPESLDLFGKKVATLLKERRTPFVIRAKRQKKKLLLTAE